MKVYIFRRTIQFISFLILMYGVYVGLRFENTFPAWQCTNSTNYSSTCYLLPLQRFQYGLNIDSKNNKGLPFPLYSAIWGISSAYLRFFLTLVIFILIFNKLWCGWLCPFGTLQDGISYARKKMLIRETQFSEKTKEILRPIKYLFLFLFLIMPFAYLFGFKADTPIFCKICPARPFLSIFEGNLLNLGVGNPPGFIFSIFTCVIAGFTLVGLIFRERFFCIFCPISGLIHIFNKFSFLKLKKNINSCDGCGNCWRICPMDIKGVYLEKNNENIIKEECMFCLRCIEACPKDNTLSISFLKKSFFHSSRRYFINTFVRNKKDGIKN